MMTSAYPPSEHTRSDRRWRDASLARLAGLVTALVCLLSASSPQVAALDRAGFPSVMLWAWERPEDLRFLDADQFGVAYLAQTLRLSNGRWRAWPRRQPLRVAEAARLMAVTRVETDGRLTLAEDQTDELVRLVLATLAKPKVAAIQLDFDAKVSERAAYRLLLRRLRAALPAAVPLSITALASFCLGDPWLDGLPVDEVVPMLFRMGKDGAGIKRLFAQGGDFSQQRCRSSYGLATDEPIRASLAGRRVYWFNGRRQPWNQFQLESLAKHETNASS